MSANTRLTKPYIVLNGVQVTLRVQIGGWNKSVAISPVDYEVFKRWDKVYSSKVIEAIVKDIEYQLSRGDEDD